MADPSKKHDFPDISNKLSAPTRKPLFERQKAEAEEKRRRDEAETAAVYQDFVKSFDNEDDDDDGFPYARGMDRGGRGSGHGARGAFGGASRRTLTSTSLKSGPGSLGPAPPSLARKRALDKTQSKISLPRARGAFGQNDGRGASDVKSAFQRSFEDEEESAPVAERAAPKPTIHLSSLVPGMSPAAIKALIPTSIQVDGVRLLPPPAPGSSTERRSGSAIVTLAQDTPASDIDAAVSSLQNKYLGFGYKLGITRHLSSAIVGGSSSAMLSTSTTSLPFGAAPAQINQMQGMSRSHHPHRGGYAPPSSYAPQAQGRGSSGGPLAVTVRPPSDIRELKLIHKTLEALLTHGPEFEALLMTRPDVQREEKWMWLWDARSPGGIWYRWRLWEMLSGKRAKARGNQRQAYSLLFDTGAPWQSPEHNLKFEFTTKFDSFVSDPDYDSSEEEDDMDDGDKQHGGGGPGAQAATSEYLNPLHKAKLIHLLSRLPSTTSRLRKGDVARVTAFAISHAGRGSEEVVQVLIDNVHRPFVFSSANPSRSINKDTAKRARSPDQAAAASASDHDSNDERAPQPAPTTTAAAAAAAAASTSTLSTEKDDLSSATLIGLYLISDLLSSSSTSGVRHAWRYRQLFETALQQRRTFATLGGLERALGWGRLRAEKWRRAVLQLLAVWEGWCVFASAVQEQFVAAFEAACGGDKKDAATATAATGAAVTSADAGGAGVATAPASSRKKKGWKAVDAYAPAVHNAPAEDQSDVDGQPMADDDDEDVDGEPMAEDDEDVDVDGEPMEEDDDDDQDGGVADELGGELGSAQDGEAMDVDDNAAAAMPADAASWTSSVHLGEQTTDITGAGKRKRPTAADMFAESEGE